MSKKQKNVPKLRFPEFTDEWEHRKLREIATKVIEKNSSLEFDETLTNSAEHGIINQREFFDKDISNKDNINGYYVVREEDFVYNPRISTTAPVGPINRNKLGRTGIMSPLYTVFRTHDIDNRFLEWFFKSDHWHRYMYFNGDTGARSDRFSIKDTIFFDMPISVPTVAEQIKIGELFEMIDYEVTLQQRKLDQIKEYKKGMLQKMFPKDGEMVPEMRFPGFTGEWERKKLGDVSNEFRSGSFIAASNIFETGMYPVYGGNGLRGYTDSFNHDGEFALIGRQGALCGNMNYSIGKAYFTEHAVAVKANEQSDTLFLYYLLGKMNLGQYSDQSAQPGLAVGKLVKLQNLFPTNEEQVKIAQFLNKLDTLITLHQRKLEAMKEYKKGLFQQMFV